MLQKGIVELIIDKYNVKVRVPSYDKAKTSSGATSTEDLTTSIICTLPGIDIVLALDDVVYVAYEADILDNPVVVGVLQRKNVGQSNIDINASSLKVDVNCTLPENTTIGSISGSDLKNLSGIKNNILSLIDYIKELLDKVSKELLEKMFKGDMSLFPKSIVFNDEGSITEIAYDEGKLYYLKDTIFNDDGSITEIILHDGITYNKTTIFNDDGSIGETVTIT